MRLINENNVGFIRELFENGTIILFTPPETYGNSDKLIEIGDIIINEIPKLEPRIASIKGMVNNFADTSICYLRLLKDRETFLINVYAIDGDNPRDNEIMDNNINEFMSKGFTVINANDLISDLDISGFWDLNENIQQNYDDLRNSSPIGFEFFNREEYNDYGIVYTIIDSDDRGIDIQWFDEEYGDDDNFDSIYWDDFIGKLNDGFFVLNLEHLDNPFDLLDE